MDGFRACKLYMAVKLHFESEKYDVFETNGKTKYLREHYDKRRDRVLFERLAKKFANERDLIQFYVANFAYGNPDKIYSGDAHEYYDIWIKRKQSMTQVFRNDLSTIFSSLENKKLSGQSMFSIDNGDPELLLLYLGGHITLESMVIIQEFENYLTKWEPMIMLWHEYFKTIQKSRRFVKFDKDKCSTIYNQFKETLTELNHG